MLRHNIATGVVDIAIEWDPDHVLGYGPDPRVTKTLRRIDAELPVSDEDHLAMAEAQPLLPVFGGPEERISGTIVLDSGEGGKVWVNGVYVIHVMSLLWLDGVVEAEEREVERISILPATTIQSSLRVPFSMTPPCSRLPDSMEGNVVALRHAIRVVVDRPWYSGGDIVGSVPVVVASPRPLRGERWRSMEDDVEASRMLLVARRQFQERVLRIGSEDERDEMTEEEMKKLEDVKASDADAEDQLPEELQRATHLLAIADGGGLALLNMGTCIRDLDSKIDIGVTILDQSPAVPVSRVSVELIRMEGAAFYESNIIEDVFHEIVLFDANDENQEGLEENGEEGGDEKKDVEAGEAPKSKDFEGGGDEKEDLEGEAPNSKDLEGEAPKSKDLEEGDDKKEGLEGEAKESGSTSTSQGGVGNIVVRRDTLQKPKGPKFLSGDWSANCSIDLSRLDVAPTIYRPLTNDPDDGIAPPRPIQSTEKEDEEEEEEEEEEEIARRDGAVEQKEVEDEDEDTAIEKEDETSQKKSSDETPKIDSSKPINIGSISMTAEAKRRAKEAMSNARGVVPGKERVFALTAGLAEEEEEEEDVEDDFFGGALSGEGPCGLPQFFNRIFLRLVIRTAISVEAATIATEAAMAGNPGQDRSAAVLRGWDGDWNKTVGGIYTSTKEILLFRSKIPSECHRPDLELHDGALRRESDKE